MALIASAIPVAPQSLYEVLGVLAFLIMTATQVRSWFARIPQPMLTKRETRYATDEEVERLREDIAALKLLIDENYKQAIKAGESRATKIHDRINAISENMPNRIIEILHKTGAIKP